MMPYLKEVGLGSGCALVHDKPVDLAILDERIKVPEGPGFASEDILFRMRVLTFRYQARLCDFPCLFRSK